MARISAGPNGPLTGRVGNLVYSSWKGIPYIKSLPKKRTGKTKPDEQANRHRFAISQEWLSPVVEFVRTGFKGFSPTVEGFIAAKSYLIRNAIEGEGLEAVVNPALVKVSHGDLPLPKDLTAGLDNTTLRFTWDNAIADHQRRDDQAMVLAYDIDNLVPAYTTSGQFRHTGQHELELAYTGPGRVYHIYFAMISPNRDRQSDSVYLGSFTL